MELNEQVKEEFNTNIEIEQVKEQKEQQLVNLPRLQEMENAEHITEIKTNTENNIKARTNVQDRIFTKKIDERKSYLQKRLKIATTVYIFVATALFALVGVNIATLVTQNKSITENVKTAQSQVEQIAELEQNAINETGTGLEEIVLNTPRDYSKEKQDLSFLDKLTILFRSLF